MPFLFIAGRLYGATALGRFASALVIVELLAMICTLGEKRGLAQRLSDAHEDSDPAHIVCDGLLTALVAGCAAALVLWLVPALMFPSGVYSTVDKLLVLAIPALALTEILLAAQAYRYDVGTTVRARAIVEPWTISIGAGVLLPCSSRRMACSWLTWLRSMPRSRPRPGRSSGAMACPAAGIPTLAGWSR